MKTYCVSIGLLLLVILAACKPPSQSEASSIRQYLQENHPNFSGTILVAREGKIILSQGFGMADYEKEIANTPQTKFLIASVTKTFTAMGIIILQERSQLNVSDPICKYITDCPEAWKPVTIHHLLTHTAGFLDTLPYDEVHREKLWMPEEIISTFKDNPLVFTPGVQFSYCNPCYILLGYIIEQVSGKPYGDFLSENIFEPLGMIDSGYNPANQRLEDQAQAQGYSIFTGSLTADNLAAPSLAYSAGGLYSTVEDLYRWDQALYSDQLVSQKSLESIFTPYVTASFRGINGEYGYGWFITEHAGHRLICHGGEGIGFAALLTRYPDERVTVIVLSNVYDKNVADIALEISDILLGEH